MIPTRKKLRLGKFYFMLFSWTGISIYFGLFEYFILLDNECYVYDDSGNFSLLASSEQLWETTLVNALGGFLGGIIGGGLEVYFFYYYLRKKNFFIRVIIKSSLILFSITIVYMLVTLIYQVFMMGNSLIDGNTWSIIFQYLSTRLQFIRVINWSFVIILSYSFLEIADSFGNYVFWDFLLGKYHQPKAENRIFMFLDIKSSTQIAEKLGHKQYFQLLNEFFADITDPIIFLRGEIYQYVGDEVVVSWKKESGLHRNRCIRCFFDIEAKINSLRTKYVEMFGILPEFKAGIHMGEVMAGEMGIIKKELIFSGDVLNTASRIQAKCNSFQAKLLISGTLLRQLPHKEEMVTDHVGNITLRGKSELVDIYQVTQNS